MVQGEPQQSDDVKSVNPSEVTGATHKSMISSLQRQLQEEKDARSRLENELNSLKQISLDITHKLDKNEKKRYH